MLYNVFNNFVAPHLKCKHIKVDTVPLSLNTQQYKHYLPPSALA